MQRRATPNSGAMEIAPSDAELSPHPTMLYIAGGGDVELVPVSGDTVTFKDVPSGNWIPVLTVKVTPGTTATGIVGVY